MVLAPVDMAPRQLVVEVGMFQPAKTYDLCDEEANGQPLWKLEGRNSWIYNGSDSRWYISDPVNKDVKEDAFQCNRGSIHSVQPAENRLPCEIGAGSWQFSGSSSPRMNAGIRVSAGISGFVPRRRFAAADAAADPHSDDEEDRFAFSAYQNGTAWPAASTTMATSSYARCDGQWRLKADQQESEADCELTPHIQEAEDDLDRSDMDLLSTIAAISAGLAAASKGHDSTASLATVDSEELQSERVFSEEASVVRKLSFEESEIAETAESFQLAEASEQQEDGILLTVAEVSAEEDVPSASELASDSAEGCVSDAEVLEQSPAAVHAEPLAAAPKEQFADMVAASRGHDESSEKVHLPILVQSFRKQTLLEPEAEPSHAASLPDIRSNHRENCCDPFGGGSAQMSAAKGCAVAIPSWLLVMFVLL